MCTGSEREVAESGRALPHMAECLGKTVSSDPKGAFLCISSITEVEPAFNVQSPRGRGVDLHTQHAGANRAFEEQEEIALSGGQVRKGRVSSEIKYWTPIGRLLVRSWRKPDLCLLS